MTPQSEVPVRRRISSRRRGLTAGSAAGIRSTRLTPASTMCAPALGSPMLLRSPISVDPRATFEFGGHVFSIYEFPKIGTGLRAHAHGWEHWTYFIDGGVRI